MKVLDAIEAARGDRVMPRGRFANINATYEATAPEKIMMGATHWMWQFGLGVGVTTTGPDEAREDMAEKAKKMIARELYGEVVDDLHELMRVLDEEEYRPMDDPATSKIRTMIRKLNGDQ